MPRRTAGHGSCPTWRFAHGLSALHDERWEEDGAGHVRWLRPDFPAQPVRGSCTAEAHAAITQAFPVSDFIELFDAEGGFWPFHGETVRSFVLKTL